MVDKNELSKYYKENLEKDIVVLVAEKKKISIREAFDLYYSSKLATQIEKGEYGIENLGAQYLAEDLIQNEL